MNLVNPEPLDFQDRLVQLVYPALMVALELLETMDSQVLPDKLDSQDSRDRLAPSVRQELQGCKDLLVPRFAVVEFHNIFLISFLVMIRFESQVVFY